MASFGQQFIASLTQPSYSEGMFKLGSTIGQAPALAAEREQRQSMLKQIMEGTPVQQARALQQEGLRTGNIQAVIQGKQLEKQTLDEGVQQGIDAIKARMLKLPDEQLDAAQQNLETYVKSVGGNVLEVANVATQIRDQRRQQELNNRELEQVRRKEQEQKLIDTFFAVPEQNREQYLEGAASKGFGDIAAKLQQRELERKVEQDKLQTILNDKTKPVDVSSIRERANSLEGGRVRDDLLKRIDEIEKGIPNFKAGQTFNSGERATLIKELNNVNDDISRAAATLDSADLLIERQTRNEIDDLRSSIAKYSPKDNEVKARAKTIKKEKGSWRASKEFEDEAREKLKEEYGIEVNKEIERLQARLEKGSDEGQTESEEDSNQGSKANPYTPTTAKELEKIPAGEHFIDPYTKQLKRK